MKIALKKASPAVGSSTSADDIAALKSTVSALKVQLESTVLVHVLLPVRASLKRYFYI